MLEKIKEGLRHNQFLSVALVVVIAMTVWLVGCQSKTDSILTPDEQVNRAELNIEIQTFKSKVEEAVKDLDQQDAFKQELFNIGIVMAKGGTIDPVGAGITLLGILGIGSVVDNRRKDAVIKSKSNALEAFKTTTVEASVSVNAGANMEVSNGSV